MENMMKEYAFMNDTLNTLLTRRSIRAYKPGQISEADLAAVLEAGEYAPSGSGKQSPIFVVVQDADIRAQLARMNAAVMGKEGTDPYYGAPTIILVFGDSERSTGFEDACLALGNMYNAAASLGLGSCWIHREKDMFAADEGRALMNKWGVPARYYGVGSCILGQPAAPPAPPAPRKDGYVIRV